MRGGKKFDLVSIGEAVIDLLPGEKENELLYMPGGAPLNCAVMAARSGCRTGFCGRLASDFYGGVLKAVLDQYMVELLCRNDNDKRDTTATLVTLDANGERRFHFPRYTGADWELNPDDIDIQEVTDTCILHFGLRSVLRNPISRTVGCLLETAGSKGVIISCDVNYRGETRADFVSGKRKLTKRLPQIDIMKISREEALLLGGQEHVRAVMEQNNIAMVVETLGEDGAVCYYRGETISHHGFKTKPTDTTGAGDAFWGAFLAKLLEGGMDKSKLQTIGTAAIKDALGYGNAAAGIAVRTKGAIASLPDKEQIDKFLGEAYG